MKRPNSNTPNLKHFYRSRSRWIYQHAFRFRMRPYRKPQP